MEIYRNGNPDFQTAEAGKYPQGYFKDDIDVLKAGIKYLEGATTIPKGSTLK